VTRPPLADRYDLVVVGAGITGVHVAREAALRHRSVLLVDKGDYGSGTSAATTKYLHGGIRYLEQYDVAVVRQSLRERRIAALSAPHLVRQTRFLLPAWSWSRPGAVKLGAGALLYDALSYDRNREAPAGLRVGRSRWLGRRATRRAVPWLEPSELRGAVAITETLNVHPERLLLEFLRDAAGLGVTARNHTEVTGFVTSPAGIGRAGDGTLVVSGVDLLDVLDGTRSQVAATTVVNAAGPWMGAVLGRLTGTGRVGPTVSPSKGVHVLTRPGTSTSTDAVMARARNGRHVVVSPWMGRELIGPTDTPVDDPPDAVSADGDDVDALLAIVNSCRAAPARLGYDDVDDVTVGIRPLVGDGGDTYTASRRHRLYDHAADGVRGLWSIAGGKWTTGRGVAEDLLDQLTGHTLGRRSPSRRRAVPGASGWAADPAEVFALAARHRPDAGIGARIREHLARLYGTRAAAVIDLAADDPGLAAPVSTRPGCDDIAAQVVLAVTDEDARTLSDIVDRRLILGTLGRVTLDELERVARVAGPLLGWADPGLAAAAEFERREERRARWRP
jgi:glycerol-3-phosphate dehydrogenase